MTRITFQLFLKNMDTKNTYNLDLSSFVLGFEDYRQCVIRFYSEIDKSSGIARYLPTKIYDYLIYKNISFETEVYDRKSVVAGFTKAVNSSAFKFISKNFFSEKDKMLGFLQLVIDEYKPKEGEGLEDLKILFFEGALIKFYELEIIKIISNPIFNLDFYFDEKDFKIKRKVDPITTQNINFINESLEKRNQDLYQKCVEEFLTFVDHGKSTSDFYHESLDRMKEVLENILTIHYQTRLSETNKFTNLLFDGQNEEMKNILKFIITKIHHNETGTRSKINKKEYNYIWLELNKLIYLVTKYKPITTSPSRQQ